MCYFKIIGASLSEPHIDELNVRNLLYNIIMYGTSVTRAPLYTFGGRMMKKGID